MSSSSSTVLSSIEDKYAYDDEDYCGFIVFVSNSPESRRGMFPPVMTLCEYDIEAVGIGIDVGTNQIAPRKLSHITELDLTDNLIKCWSEVANM